MTHLMGDPLPKADVAAIQEMRGGGSPLDRDLASSVGTLLNFDFSDVRIHTHDSAAAMTRQVGAEAFAMGRDIFFGAQKYDPDSNAGRTLIAHELVHVVQQMTGRAGIHGSGIVVNGADDPLEHEAHAVSESMCQRAICQRADLDVLRNSPRYAMSDGLSRVIQRAPAQIVAAANVPPPAPGAPGPATCHQAAIGWLLAAEGYTRPWQLLQQINGTFFVPRDISMWARDHIYNLNAQLNRAELTGGTPAWEPSVGDILFTQQGPNVAHSLVVVRKGGGQIFVRGFNNAGTFNYPGVAIPAPPGAYDNNDRDICDVNLWNPAGTGFGAGGGMAQLRWVRYQNAANKIRQALRHWSYSMLRTPGWRHAENIPRPCPGDCPRN